MSFLNSLFNTATGTPSTGGRPGAPAPTVTPGAPAVAATPAAPAAPVEPSFTSELDKFKSMWQTPTTDDGKPVQAPVDPLSQPVFTLDRQKVIDSAGKMNFTGEINPELLQKALGGDGNALAAIIDGAVRNAVAGVTLSQADLLNQAMLTNNQRVTAALPTHINRTTLLNSQTDDPVLSHPAVQPLLTALKQTAFARNPNAKPADIEAEVHNYIRGLATAVVDSSPENIKRQQQQQAGEVDWMSALGIPATTQR
jgi:hypothetical protein